MPARLAALLPAALLLFVAAAFALPNQSAYALIFYLAGLPTIAAALVRRRPAPDPALLLALALIVFSGLTLAWGHDDGHRSARFAWDTCNTLAFVLGMALALPDPQLRDQLGRLLSGIGAANAILAIALGQILPVVGPRLHGWGVTRHPILGAAAMSVACLTALYRGLSGAARPRLHLAAAAVMAIFVLLTESRGPLLAGSIGMLFLCAAGPWRWRALAGFALAVGVWWALPAAVQHHAEAVVVARGSSHRWEIWRYALGVIAERPLLGHGLADNLHLDVADRVGRAVATEHITFAHDLYLSLLFYSGVAGFLLFVALAVLLTGRLLRARNDPAFPWLGALWLNALFAGLTDLGQVTKGPGPLWFILWLPIGLILTYPTRSRPGPS